MKKMMMFGALILAAAGTVQARPFFEVQGGIYAGDKTSPLYGVRGGARGDMFEVSGGYWAALGDTDLHTIGAEFYDLIPITHRTTVKGGFGVGYTIPSLPGSEKGDNGLSWGLGVGADHQLNQSATLGFGVKWFLFRTDTHSTTYGSHPETLNNGQSVEVLDVFHQNNSVNFNALLLAAELRF